MSIYSRTLGALAILAMVVGFIALQSGENDTYGNSLFFSGMVLWFLGVVLGIAWAVERFYRLTEKAGPKAPETPEPDHKTMKKAA